MTPSQANTLLHTLSYPGRNHYVASNDDPDIAALVAEGLMVEVKSLGPLRFSGRACGDHLRGATK